MADITAWTFARFAEAIAALPADVTAAHVEDPSLLLHRSERLGVFYAPFEWVERRARLVLLGLAPGRFQARNALQAARDGLVAGRPHEEVAMRARLAGSFSGPIRARLVTALDAVGTGPALGLDSAAALLAEKRALVHLTAAVRFPVFVQGQNWTGVSPPLRRVPLLQEVVRHFLAAELAQVRNAVVLPLGQGATDAARLLVAEGRLPADRLVEGLPHPSPANGHFRRLLAERAQEVGPVLAERLAKHTVRTTTRR